MKKVAFTPSSSNISNTRSVIPGTGPSSNVRATSFCRRQTSSILLPVTDLITTGTPNQSPKATTVTHVNEIKTVTPNAMIVNSPCTQFSTISSLNIGQTTSRPTASISYRCYLAV